MWCIFHWFNVKNLVNLRKIHEKFMNLTIILRFGSSLAFPFIVDNAREKFFMRFLQWLNFWGSMEGKWIFNIFNFIKFKIYNLLTKHLALCLHVWAIIFDNEFFFVWWNCGDLSIEKTPICFECLKAFQL